MARGQSDPLPAKERFPASWSEQPTAEVPVVVGGKEYKLRHVSPAVVKEAPNKRYYV